MGERCLNVLLVEDNDGDIELTKISFARAGVSCSLIAVQNGEEAIEYLCKRGVFKDVITPDLILTDLNMPRMSGKDILAFVKNNERLKGIPVIILTSSLAPGEILECYRLHANCYILKPFEVDCFVSIIKSLDVFWMGLKALSPEYLSA